METVFITIHDLSLDARIKYVSDSVEDILGYMPNEVRGKSCWQYFHPDEIPFARAIHGRGIKLDKAAVLHYCRIKHKDGSWIGCECVFTVVYDVLVGCTSIYTGTSRSHQRASDAPAIRRIFSSSPRDPRYHMLSYISAKFSQVPQPHSHEPRAALFLNRFTRSSSIMFATDTVSNILGITAEQLIGQSFYYCISENCLQDAVRCLESAKANDSIAYLRFWFRSPLPDGRRSPDASMPDVHSSSDEDEDEGGVRIARPDMISDTSMESISTESSQFPTNAKAVLPEEINSRSSSENSTDLEANATDRIFDVAPVPQSSHSSQTPPSDNVSTFQPVEVEAVVSCTSDGLVVILRNARPLVPQAFGPEEPVKHTNGLFASPWATEPVMPDGVLNNNNLGALSDPTSGPQSDSFMGAIREVAVFAWSLTGINGSIAEFGRGQPMGESVPPGGLPIWDPEAKVPPENDLFNGFSDNSHRRIPVYTGSSSDDLQREGSSGSDDEVVWKRATHMPEWRRPTRRGHEDAFGSEDDTREAEERDATRRRRRLDE